MSKLDEQIRKAIRDVVGNKPAVIQGEVVSVDTDELTATIKLDESGDVTQDVRLTATQGSGKFVVFPAVGTLLLAARILDAEKWVMISCDDVTDVWLRGDSDGGLIVISDLVSKLNTLESRMTSHQHIYVNPSGTPTPTAVDPATNPAITPTVPSDIENEHVKHG